MMLNVSWGDYLAATGVLALSYYAVIGAVYYRKELKDLVNSRTGRSPKPQPQPKDIEDWEIGNEEDTSFKELEEMVLDIRNNILTVAGKAASKDSLLGSLKLRLVNYDGLRIPAYRAALNNYIAEHANVICGVAFSEEELDAAWEALPR